MAVLELLYIGAAGLRLDHHHCPTGGRVVYEVPGGVASAVYLCSYSGSVFVFSGRLHLTVICLFVQAAAILKAEVYGIPRPDWASDSAAVAAAVGKVVVPEFQPKQGVRIETDPKVWLQDYTTVVLLDNFLGSIRKFRSYVSQEIPVVGD